MCFINLMHCCSFAFFENVLYAEHFLRLFVRMFRLLFVPPKKSVFLTRNPVPPFGPGQPSIPGSPWAPLQPSNPGTPRGPTGPRGPFRQKSRRNSQYTTNNTLLLDFIYIQCNSLLYSRGVHVFRDSQAFLKSPESNTKQNVY